MIDEDSKREEAAISDKRIKDLEMQEFARARDTIVTNYFLHSKTIMKPWIQSGASQ